MSLTITREQRDAIYEVVIDHPSGIDDVWMAVDQRDFATAKRLGRLFAEDLRLLEDLGWNDHIDSRSARTCRARRTTRRSHSAISPHPKRSAACSASLPRRARMWDRDDRFEAIDHGCRDQSEGAGSAPCRDPRALVAARRLDNECRAGECERWLVDDDA